MREKRKGALKIASAVTSRFVQASNKVGAKHLQK